MPLIFIKSHHFFVFTLLNIWSHGGQKEDVNKSQTIFLMVRGDVLICKRRPEWGPDTTLPFISYNAHNCLILSWIFLFHPEFRPENQHLCGVLNIASLIFVMFWKFFFFEARLRTSTLAMCNSKNIMMDGLHTIHCISSWVLHLNLTLTYSPQGTHSYVLGPCVSNENLNGDVFYGQRVLRKPCFLWNM